MEGRSDEQIQHYINDYLESDSHRDYLRERIVSNLQPGSILDLGSASGTLFEEALASDLDITQMVGIELSEDLHNTACKKRIPKANLLNIDVRCFDYPEETFDNVVMCSTLHEVISFCGIRDVGVLLNRIYSTLKPNGRLIISDGFKNDSVIANFRIHNPSKLDLFRNFTQLRPDISFHAGPNDTYISNLTSIFEFVHKSYYLDNWNHEVRENYYPIPIETYLLSLYSSGFTDVQMVNNYPETDNIESIGVDYEIKDQFGRDLHGHPCNLLLVATK